ncbi:SMP-30/gluconolactonase/LRE family protein [Gordonia sp. NPDC003429]
MGRRLWSTVIRAAGVWVAGVWVAGVWAAGVTVVITFLAATPAQAAPPPTPQCAATVTTLFGSPSPTAWAENLTFDAAGNLWTSRLLDNTVQRRDTTGRVTATVPVTAPGAVRPGPDGKLYVNSGNLPLNGAPGAPRTATVMRFDPAAARPVPQVWARGLGAPNGLAFDAHGYAYVTDGALGVVRLRPDGSIDEEWTAASPQNFAPTRTVNGTGTNGAVVIGDTLYVTLTASATGRVLAVPLDAPAKARAAVDLTAPRPGFLDDVDALGPHTLAVGTVTGQVFIVDLQTGERCVVDVGRPVTAIAHRPGESQRLVVASETGELLAVRLR